MGVHFSNNSIAENRGWLIITPFIENSSAPIHQRFKALGEHGLGAFQKITYRIALFCACLFTLGFALKIASIRQLQEDLKVGKQVREIYCESLIKMDPIQPKIIANGWGEIDISTSGKIERFKDVVLLPTVAKEWNWGWKSDPMHHHPGIRKSDIDQYIFSSLIPDVLILSQGRGHGGGLDNPGPGILEIEAGLQTYLKQKGVKEIHILKTAAAIQKYADLSALGTKSIAAMIHTTC